MIIYKVFNIVNNKCYIGQTIRLLKIRKAQHISIAKLKGDNYFHKALRYWPENTWSWEIIYTCNTLEELNDKEEYFIKLFNSTNSDCGYNLMPGGANYYRTKETNKKISNSNMGRKYSPETIDKMRQSHIGKIIPEEVKLKMSQTKKGKKCSESAKIKLRKINLGKKASVDTIKKLSISHLGQRAWNIGYHKSLIYIYNFINPSNIKYENISDLFSFCQEHKLNYECVHQALRLQQSHYKNWQISRIKKSDLQQPVTHVITTNTLLPQDNKVILPIEQPILKETSYGQSILA